MCIYTNIFIYTRHMHNMSSITSQAWNHIAPPIMKKKIPPDKPMAKPATQWTTAPADVAFTLLLYN